MNAEQNKAVVRRMNKEFIEGGNMQTLNEIFSEDFINYTAPPNTPNDKQGVIYFFNHFLKPAFPDLKVEIHDMIADDDKVTTRKSFYATHKGDFLGIKPTNKSVTMEVIDIIALKNSKFVGHWGILDLHSLLAQITE